MSKDHNTLFIFKAMNPSPHRSAGIFGVAATLLILAGVCTFASMRPDYSHIRHTISELGASGASLANLVNFGLFLPTGLLVVTALYILYPCYSNDRFISKGLLAYSALGLGYIMSAFFPCDPGSPTFGSWRQQLHNLFGLVEYLGAGIGLIVFGRSILQTKLRVAGTALILSGATVLVCLVLLSMPRLFDIRGFIQRIAETILFGWLTLASIWQIFHPNHAAHHAELCHRKVHSRQETYYLDGAEDSACE